MRSKKSFFNSMLCRKNLTHFWPVWVLYTIFLICVIPIRILLLSTADRINYGGEDREYTMLWDYLYTVFGNVEGRGDYMVIISLIIGIVVAAVVFAYMYNNKSSHMFHSLPVTRLELFFSNYIAGILMLIIPLVLIFLSSVIVCILCGITALEYLMLWFLIMAGESFFFYSMSILVGMFVGRLMVMPIFVVILNFLYIGCRYILTSLVGTISYGLSESYANRQNSILSPVLYLRNHVGIVNGNPDEFGTPQFEVRGMEYVAVYAGIAVVFTILAYLMYRKRNLETAGEILSISITKPVFRWGMSACVAFLSAMVLNNVLSQVVRSPIGEFVEVLLSVCLVGFMTFFITEMFLKKKIAVFSKKRFLECGVFMGLSALLVIGMECDLFGMERRIPPIDKIDKISVEMYYELEVSDTESMEELMAIHRQIIDSKSEFEQYESMDYEHREMMQAEFDYYLTNGDVIVRSYMIPIAPAYYKNADSVVSKLYAVSVEPENYLKGNVCVNYNTVRPSMMQLDIINSALEYESVDIPPAEALRIYNAYIKDIKEGHIYLNTTNDWTAREPFFYANTLYTELYREHGVIPTWDEQKWMGTESAYYGRTLTLNVKCTNTIAILKELGYIDEDRRLMTEEEYSDLSEVLYETE